MHSFLQDFGITFKLLLTDIRQPRIPLESADRVPFRTAAAGYVEAQDKKLGQRDYFNEEARRDQADPQANDGGAQSGEPLEAEREV